MIAAAGVVVPARDEEDLLPACLRALDIALHRPDLSAIECHVVVVLDDCGDASADIARRSRGDSRSCGVLEVAHRNVGLARGAGIEELLVRLAHRDPRDIWIATTDADTRVPPDWLCDQIRLADAGSDVVVGTIAVDDWSEWPSEVRLGFERRYAIADDGTHMHVHGANLGFRASTYHAAGGMPGVPLAEDHGLLEVLSNAGAVVARTSGVPVVTSSRRQGRAPGGFADLLSSLVVSSAGAVAECSSSQPAVMPSGPI